MTTYTAYDDIILENYSEKAIVVKGNTNQYKTELMSMGGKYNSNLKGGAGWIFPAFKESVVRKWLETGQRVVTESQPKTTPKPTVTEPEKSQDLHELLKRL
jgi:hypothetical protein